MFNVLGLTGTEAIVLLVLVAGFIYFYKDKITNTSNRRHFVIAGSALILIVLLVSNANILQQGSIPGERLQRGEWQESYIAMASEELSLYEDYVANTIYYDYDHPEITRIAEEIASTTRSAEEAMRKTLAYVYDNVEYDFFESDEACFERTAPEILEIGSGQCDTQSIVVISILRKMGVAANPAGGCIVHRPICSIQSILPIRQPVILDITPEDLEEDILGRGQDLAPTGRGGLHAWVTAWDPNKGWLDLEATTGRMADTFCYNYHVELFPANHEKNLICVTYNVDYARACRVGDMDTMDAHGLGLTSEVNPE